MEEIPLAVIIFTLIVVFMAMMVPIVFYTYVADPEQHRTMTLEEYNLLRRRAGMEDED